MKPTHALAYDNSEPLRLLRPRECATALGVSLTTLWRWTQAGDFPIAYRLGPNSVAFDAKEITAWLAARRVKARGK